jgi:membrane fusion protein, multidrug efflux system
VGGEGWPPGLLTAGFQEGGYHEKRVPETMTRVRKFLLPLLLLPVMVLASCGDGGGPAPDVTGSGAIERPRETSAVPVAVAKVKRTTIPVELRAIGTGQAYKTVSVESQVAGIVKDVHYRQGQFVHQGDRLITLDKSPFLAALEQSQAALTRDQAQAQLDQVELQRYEGLYKQGIVSKEQYDQYLATSTAAGATVNVDQAAIQTAKIQLSYCSIYAPISGVTGAQLVYPGAAVKANDVPVLVVINQVSPIYVNFSVPQQYLESVKRLMARSRLPVQATPTGDSAPENGVLTFVNNTVDPTTGTISLEASFPNTDRQLWPGQFSNVLLRLGEQPNVLVVPAQAVQAGQQGDYVFVTKPDMTVDVRQVNVGQTVNNETEIVRGLSPGETVVTDGQVRLVPGTKIYVTRGL